MSMKSIPPLTPLLYSKIGVCRGIPIFNFYNLRKICVLHGRVSVLGAPSVQLEEGSTEARNFGFKERDCTVPTDVITKVLKNTL